MKKRGISFIEKPSANETRVVMISGACIRLILHGF